MKIARFEPWSYVDLMHRNLTRDTSENANSDWVPAVDILEEKSRFVLRADVPGVRPEDIDITLDAGVLTVSGTRIAASNEDDVDVRRSERASGGFSRRFTLPKSTDADRITAKCRDGILEVLIEKTPEIQARQIAVIAA